MDKPPVLISCDEAGFTGPKLLDDNQPIFSYSAIDLSVVEAEAIVKAIKTKYRVQAPELKSKLMRKRENWPAIAFDIVQHLSGRAIVIAADKRLNLGGKAFEYLFEPVLQAKNGLFYRHGLHRFVMNSMHRILFAAGQPVPDLAHELQAFMKSFDPADAPTLFAAAADAKESSEILDCVLRFARGYADTIAEQTKELRADESQIGKWTLDLTTTCLFSLILQGWGHRHEKLDILCDDSKPLQAMAHIFDGFVDRSEVPEIEGGRQPVTIHANLANPLRFGSSTDNPTLQLADIVAGATADVLQHVGEDPYHDLYTWVGAHMHKNYMLPDDHLIDTKRIEARVNFAVLRELARRADKGEDPLDGIETFYAEEFRRQVPALRALLAAIGRGRR